MTLSRKAGGVLVVAAAAVPLSSPYWQAATAAEKADFDNPQFALGISENFGKWQGGVINWVYNPTGAPPGWTDDNYTLSQFELALDEWEGVCGVTFVGRGVDDGAVNGGPDDGEVVFEWDAGIGGASGQAGPEYAISAGVLTEYGLYPYTDGSLKMNPNSFFVPGNATAAQIEQTELQFNNTAVHELGHLIGFGHSDDPVSRMYANPYNSLAHLREDDIQGCQALYGLPQSYVAPPTYIPPAAGTSPFSSLFLASSENTSVPLTAIDDDSDWQLAARFEYVAAGAEDLEITSVVVDPQGYKNIVNSRVFSFPSGGNWSASFTMISFDRLRELPGTWTVHIIMGGETVATMTVEVTTALPDYNQPPVATLTVSDVPSTREVSLTVDVSSDGDADTQNVSIIWHIPTIGAPRTDLFASSGSDTQFVDFDDAEDHEIFAEVIDDGPRYDGSLPLSSAAGDGFQTLLRYVSRLRSVRGDQNGDGKSDILFRNNSTGANQLYLMNGAAIGQNLPVSSVAPTWRAVGRGDYNGDGRSDILWRYTPTGALWIYLMNGNALTSSVFVGTVADSNWKVVGNGDYNGDGKSDILWHHAVNGTVWLYQMNSNVVSLSAGIGVVPNTDWQIVGSGDYNGDGRSDVLWRNAVTGTNWMYLMNGPVIQASTGISVTPDLNWQIVGDGDYDGDGKSDILWRNAASGTNWMYLMNGTSIATSASISVLPDLNWKIVGDGDFNGDGKADVLWRNLSTGSNYMYLMDGLAITTNSQVSVVTDQNWQIVNTN
jgi:hypothetical protein